jgi:N-acetyl-anhydromuramyl-L-alanine amidase AmpD
MGQDNCNDFAIGIELEGWKADVFRSGSIRGEVGLLRAAQPGKTYAAPMVGHEHGAWPEVRSGLWI